MRCFASRVTVTVGVWRERANIMSFGKKKKKGNTAACNRDIQTWRKSNCVFLPVLTEKYFNLKNIKNYNINCDFKLSKLLQEKNIIYDNYLGHEQTKTSKWT